MPRGLPLVLGVASLCLAASGSSSLSAERVVHGVLTTDNPAVGALLLAYGDGSLYQDCSGALIGCRHVLTAAHCVCLQDTAADCSPPDPADSVFYLQHAGLFGVSSIEYSPNYEFGVRGDAAVLTLDRDVERVVPLQINSARRVPEGTAAVVTGFGVTADSANDAGLKRRGAVVTGPCPSDVPDRRHVCWTFGVPEGPAAERSNTCYGDSGSPLIADLGDGPVASGIDSGLNGRCVKNTEAYDASVFDNRSFIAAAAGADLGRLRCGEGLAHVGDAGVVTTALDGTLGFGRGARRCRKSATRALTKWIASAADAHTKCVASVVTGKAMPPCPDARAVASLERATAKLARNVTTRSCSADAVQTAAFSGACGGALDSDALTECLLTAAGDAVDGVTAGAHAVDGAILIDAGERRCQSGAANSVTGYLQARLKLSGSCRGRADRGPGRGCDAAEVSASIAKARSVLETKVSSACSDGQVVSLDATGGFGGGCSGATSVSDLQTCLISEADQVFDAIDGLMVVAEFEQHVIFDVPAGTALLRIALNGSEERGTFFHFHVADGREATPGDPGATLDSGFQALEMLSPTPGAWHALVRPAAGEGRTIGAWQLTATTFP